MKHIIQKIALAFILFAVMPAIAQASEINYGTIRDVKGEDVHIRYKSPAGEKHFVCNVTNDECSSFGSDTPTLFPKVFGVDDYANSPDGQYGLVEYKTSETTTQTFNLLFNLSGDTPQLEYYIPFDEKISRVKFTWANDNVVLFGADGTLARFNIANRSIATTSVSTSLPLRSLSPHGKYLSSYNYTDKAHRVWNIDASEKLSISASIPSFVEFSQNEQYAVFTDNPDNFETLYVIDFENELLEPQKLFTENFTVADYLFMDDDLYFIANKEHPLNWALYRYNISSKKLTKVSENISRNDYIRVVAEHMSFLTINGKNTDVTLYNPKDGSIKTISPLEPSPTPSNVTSSIIEIGDRYGVLVEPTTQTASAKPLFVWLHGGPKRQTSVGYHSYLSYAVYDELLERLVQSDAH
ncbi:MAG: DPP IV N-terminal domain-containing protein, partial [Candidatus Pacebacteria bacterium]|nr:DPP IV N-terminal domain-containing protein [Candidatus Paceibacterota bacterium]